VKRSLGFGATILVVIAVCVATAHFGSRIWRELEGTRADIAQLRDKVAKPGPTSEEGPRVMATPMSSLTKVAALLPRDVGQTLFAARASDKGYLFVTFTGEGSETPYRYWYADTGMDAAKPLVERQMGPAPVFTYHPYALPVLHVETVDAWEGLEIQYDDHVDIGSRALIATVARHGGSASVSRDGKVLTLAYVTKGPCVNPEDAGKQVDVTGIRVGKDRDVPFPAPVKAMCRYDEAYLGAWVDVTFGRPDLVTDEGKRLSAVSIPTIVTSTRVFVPLEDLDEPGKVVLR
jgi:hypothetical protein